jgi:hypothetical protein
MTWSLPLPGAVPKRFDPLFIELLRRVGIQQ